MLLHGRMIGEGMISEVYGMRLSVLIPFYNEEQQIPITLQGGFTHSGANRYEIRIDLIDDGSVTKPGRSSLKRVRRILGLSVCISPGISARRPPSAPDDQATGDAVILMDGDLQHPPSIFRK